MSDLSAGPRSLLALLERITATDGERTLDLCLDTLLELFGGNRALVLLPAAGSLQVVAARGRNRILTPFEREEISRSIVSEVERTGRELVWHPSTARMQSDSLLNLGITTALAAPLRAVAWRTDELAGDQPRGVLYLDLRDLTREITEAELELFRAATALVSVVVELSRRVQVARESLRQVRATGSDTRAPTLDELLGTRSMTALRSEIDTCLHGDSAILITGETGTGKTILARAIAEASRREPIVRATLGASDDLNTITSELFGHERGAFSGAVTRRAGLVELADKGTIIFDEILNLPAGAQQLLLDVTQFHTFRPLGHQGAEPRRVQVRVIAATNGDVEAAMREGRFRRDLYYRLAAVHLHLPPLRERREDIPVLAEGFLRRLDPGRDWRLNLMLRRVLMSPALAWPGNMRQLEGIVQRACERARAREPGRDLLGPEDLEPADLGVASFTSPDLPLAVPAAPRSEPPGLDPDELVPRWQKLLEERARLDDLERSVVVAALKKYGGVVTRAARELGLPRTSLLSRIRTLGIEES